MKYMSLVAIAAILIVTSVNSHAKVLVQLEQFPKWFKDATARETTVKKTSKLKVEEFNVDGTVKGKFKLVEEGEGTWYYTVDIGTDSPVECYIFTEYDGPANSLYALIEHSLTGVEALNNKKLTGKFNYAIDSGVINSTPYLQLDTLYNLGEGNKKVAGVLKGFSAETAQSLQVCLHNEMGYNQAFFDVFESFVTAMVENEPNSAFFEPIYQLTLSGVPIGFGREVYTTDADGDVSIEKYSAFIVPVDANTVSRTDSVTTEWSRPDGSVINGNAYTVENQVMTSQYSLQSLDGKWQVEGELQGKPIKTELAYTGWLLSGFGSHLETLNLQAAEVNSAEFNMWMPDADPTSAIQIKLSKVNDNPNANLKINMGPIVMDFMANKKGVFEKGTINQGPLTMGIKLIYVQGEPTLP
ncbi:hypothetical protein [uncultured Paraglaciecola sp.]|uniref:hypothetical protein n=1 Tax=uncultured Paraglaciecola sp. TaxID=1765024 RepID=UPI00259256F9|nr:hypothetical protein [uncultured Paraglaciecola sp.]